MNLRVRTELSAIIAADAIEQAHLDDALAWVDSGAPLFRVSKPATPPKHLVSYFALVDSDQILLVDHKNAKLWLPTGGHVEPDEDPRFTVVRELKEELGINISVDLIGPPRMVTVTETVGLTSGHIDVSLWYVVKGERFAQLAYDPSEFHEVKWYPFAAAPIQRSDPHLVRFLAKLSNEV